MTILSFVRKIRSRFFPLHIRGLSDIRSLCSRKKGIEIGGPSFLFTWKGKIPLYSVVGSLDACSFSTTTLWEKSISEGKNFHFHPKKKPGFQFIGEASELVKIESETYDFLLASHVLEHCANPIKTLREWKRVVKPDGLLLLVVPHRDGTFDHKREITSFQHLVSDYEQNITEQDTTHIDEFIQSIDLSMTEYKNDRATFEERTRNNFIYRGVHHHVFNTPLLVDLVNNAVLQIMNVQTLLPFHIVITARKSLQVDNSKWLAVDAQYKQQSPFISDKH